LFALGSTKLIATLALLVSILAAGLLPGANASADVKTFFPVKKTRKALIFKIDGVDPNSIRKASATLRLRGGKLRKKRLSVRKVRAAARRGTLKLSRGRKRARARSGRVRLVVADPTRYRVPASVDRVPASVPSGCSTDATSEILSWIASLPDNSTLVFGAGACYRIEGTLELHRRSLTFDGNGSTFKSLNAPSEHRALWRAWDSNVSFRNMTIAGSYANGGEHTEGLQHAHGIDLRGTHAVVQNVSMSDLAGDCVYFGLGASRSSGAVQDSACRRIGRNAVSVTAGDDIRVTRMTTTRVGYIAFDVEPNEGSGNGSSRVVFDSNTIGSFNMAAYSVIGNAPIADQAFTNNRLVGQRMKVEVVNRSHRPQRLTITGNSSDTAGTPSAMNLEGVDGLTISGNTVPLTGGTMANIDGSCGVSVSGNSFPGGSREALITNPAC
jgi:hypothetical protein